MFDSLAVEAITTTSLARGTGRGRSRIASAMLNMAQLAPTPTASDSTATAYVSERLAATPADDTEIEIDFSGTSWEFIFQDIVRRSVTLRYVTAVTSYTCSKMRPDGFGGMAVLITADAIRGKSTNDILEDFLAEMD